MSGMEIERKFLVRGDDYKHRAHQSFRIRQGYICSGGGSTNPLYYQYKPVVLPVQPRCTVRVRIRDNQGFLTIKGPSLDGGLSRYEFEKEITLAEAEQLFHLCEPGIIDKTRYLVACGHHTFEIDEFYGDNEGLVIAEVELSSPDEPYEKPDFIGREVTGDRRYYNSHLRRNPYQLWKDEA